MNDVKLFLIYRIDEMWTRVRFWCKQVNTYMETKEKKSYFDF